jgi:hypothetical protein
VVVAMTPSQGGEGGNTKLIITSRTPPPNHGRCQEMYVPAIADIDKKIEWCLSTSFHIFLIEFHNDKRFRRR